MAHKLIVGNWKMNGSLAMAETLVTELAAKAEGLSASLAVCPPSPYLAHVSALLTGSAVALGAQTCHGAESGAHTGDVAAVMLAEFGVRYVIVGHSERRADHHEADAIVKEQATAALKAGLIPIICVGESESERDAGDAEEIVSAQIRRSLPEAATPENVVIAYEPIWAIGTGRTPSNEDILAMHAMMRGVTGEVCGDKGSLPLLYGGSVKPGNAKEILALANVDGALVGGASLKAADFLGIASAC
jgi:triosephosphate isomerase (TIM)